ncbi:protein VAPYRIN-like isoform X2 [Tripterygium wilfordii]|uniref:protein VAPYRIN-like isoform X2 n=1 Tax=Tripterygium wilfordii TaxID=458696 RepID=UPI0018F813A1|nr:protein VAPYRIN-like isoform X2 [Tripterygium wilfordii]
MERLVEVSEQEALIDFSLNCKCRANVRLTSLCATSPVAFKVQTSSPHKFLVNPPSGLVPPLSQATLQIILKPQTQLPSSFPRSPSDRFLIKTARFTTNSPESSPPTNRDSVNSWISTRQTQDIKLKVAFVGPLLLSHAVNRGDLDSTMNIIKRQKSILTELTQREAESLLRVATELDNSESMVNLLLEAGLRIDARVESDNVDSKWLSKGWSEIHAAAMFDRDDDIASLVKRQPWSLDCRDKEGRTALHLAASKGNIRCAQVLLESGADKDARSINGRTALHRAAANGDRSMVELLIEMGGDPTIEDDKGLSALDVARNEGIEEILEVMEQGEQVLMAARRGDIKHLESLLRRGASTDYRDQYGLTPLHAAAIRGHKDIALRLLALGVDLECQDNEGHSPLHLAVEGGWMGTVEVLVNNGANVNAKTKRGATPIYMAEAFGYSDILMFLKSKGVCSSSWSSSLSSIL